MPDALHQAMQFANDRVSAFSAGAFVFEWSELPLFLVLGFVLYTVDTVAFDLIHHLLHLWMRSRFKLLQAIGSLHAVHHDYLDRRTRFHDELAGKNYVKHHLPEFATQVAVCLAIGVLLMPPPVVVGVVAVHTGIFVVVSVLAGRDANHRVYDKLPAPLHSVFVGPRYHAMHHIYPEHYMGSFLTLYDRLFGLGLPLEGKRVVMTGASGAFGSAMKTLLERRGVQSVTTFRFGHDYTYEDYSRLDPALAEADILVLCHGSKRDHAMEANCDSFVALIERFKALTADRFAPPEVWATGSEAEAHPHFGNETLKIYGASKRAFAKHAWRYYRDPSILYRHIVCSAFTSPMGPGLISGKFAARWALFFLERGFQYIPVTYTSIALWNWFKFLLPLKTAPAPDSATHRVGPEHDPPMEHERRKLAAAA